MGVYADLPLPEVWRPTLTGLEPLPALPAARPLPSLGALVDSCLDLLPERQARMVWARLGAEQTLQEVGEAHNLTRERVRQVVGKVTQAFLRDQRLRLVLDGVFLGLARERATLVDVSGAGSSRVPEATPEQLWTFVMGVWNGVQARRVSTCPVQAGVFLFAPAGLLDDRQVRQLMLDRGSFLHITQVAAGLGVPEAEAEVLACASPRLVRTRSGLYGYLGWTLPTLLKAVAEQLAHAGFTEWHFSEIGKAAAVFDADWGRHPPRNIAAVLSRPDVPWPWFEYAGRKGYWRLRSVGDGHADNRAAIRAILEDADLPLHWSTIQARLARQVQEGTIFALLGREPEFQALGRGVFGLKDRPYAAPHPEDAFMQEQFARTNNHALPAAEILKQAAGAGLDPERLLTLGRTSQTFRYWRWGNNEALFLTPEEACLRHFQRWFDHRSTRDVPDTEVLRAGLRAAYERLDRETLRLTYAHLQDRALPLPPEAAPWVDWALG